MDLAHHRPEYRIILISASNVTLDLQGYTLGRGRIFRNPGDSGIEIFESVENVVIKNGTLRDFDEAIYRPVSGQGLGKHVVTPEYEASSNTYRIAKANITVQNIVFERNRLNFHIQQKN